MRGRPQLFTNRHMLTVIVSRETYDALRSRVEEIALDHSGFSLSDLLRRYIDAGLGRRAPALKPFEERSARARQLMAISRTVRELARELD